MVGYDVTPAVGRESDKFMLRLPDGMRDRLKCVAERNRRSMNAEIIDALEAHISAIEVFGGVGDSATASDALAEEIANAVRLITLRHLRGKLPGRSGRSRIRSHHGQSSLGD